MVGSKPSAVKRVSQTRRDARDGGVTIHWEAAVLSAASPTHCADSHSTGAHPLDRGLAQLAVKLDFAREEGPKEVCSRPAPNGEGE